MKVLQGGTDLVMWSAFVGLLMLLWWMRGVQVERGAMAHFALRGATLGLALSVPISSLVLRLSGVCSPDLATFLESTGAVGAAEELSKFLALIWLSWSGTMPWRRKLSPRWPNTKKGIMLAGLCVGIGFMVIENSLYAPSFVQNIQEDMLLANLLGDEDAREFLSVLFEQFVFFRVLINPHPYLTGIVAGRFAACEHKKLDQRLSVGIFWKVLWPSVVLHALCNLADGFWVKVGGIGMCIWAFRRTWYSLEKLEASDTGLV